MIGLNQLTEVIRISGVSSKLLGMSSVMLQHPHSLMQQLQIEWRRAKVLELSSQGYSQIETATNLQIDKLIISTYGILDSRLMRN
jgi:hypothetical protein